MSRPVRPMSKRLTEVDKRWAYERMSPEERGRVALVGILTSAVVVTYTAAVGGALIASAVRVAQRRHDRTRGALLQAVLWRTLVGLGLGGAVGWWALEPIRAEVRRAVQDAAERLPPADRPTV